MSIVSKVSIMSTLSHLNCTQIAPGKASSSINVSFNITPETFCPSQQAADIEDFSSHGNYSRAHEDVKFRILNVIDEFTRESLS